MGGGLMQLVAYGAQDIYLTGNPQITFFKVVYRRHTNFSMEAIQQVFDGTTDFGNTVSATISRNGDLIHRMYLEHDALFTHGTSDANNNLGTCEHYGHSLIKECEIEIGGQRIDKHYSMWNRVWSDLTEVNPSGHFGASIIPLIGGGSSQPVSGNGTIYQLMTGNGYGLNTDDSSLGSENDFSGADGVGHSVNGFTYDGNHDTFDPAILTVNKIFLPLYFWFNRNPGLSLPLIALQYHEVKIKMTFESINNILRADETLNFESPITGLGGGSVVTSKNFDLWCDYIYLDTDERRRFAQVSHEYLIEQLQRSEHTITTQSHSIELNFNHPVKELIWVSQNSGLDGRYGLNVDKGAEASLTDATASPVSVDTMGGNWKLKLNGHDRFSARDSKYFTRTQVWQHHTGYGSVPTVGQGDDHPPAASDTATSMGGDGIAVYSFSLKPEEHQPSGTCNFSRIDNAQLVGSSLTIFDVTSTDQKVVDGGDNTLKLTVFAVNYNVLRIMSGMGGLAYSN